MQGRNVRVRSSEGGEFDCYRVSPRAGAKVPAIVKTDQRKAGRCELRSAA